MTRAVLLTALLAACNLSGPSRFRDANGHYSIAALDGWTQSRDLGATVFSDGHGATIAIRAAGPRDPALLFAATERTLASLPGAQVDASTALELRGFQARSYTLTFVPSRGQGQRYERRHIVILGRNGRTWHLLHTAKAGALAESAAEFDRTVKSFREEG